ncbi:hypothetical protein [Flavobacterium sp. K5-23]|uniref:hypothetical protein n=1 Tax=Flavobacterium sp. K5-23 TaxID=2746225 RepID=UPI00200E8CC6|nr:hypothetical protein [Flavobacterium sp. K5-23]UQD57228.1 hypothetical protein FLAK523_12825 [Flavobacterium sp. K5-23]
MNYCVLVKISKRMVSFWYQSEGSAYEPLVINRSNEVPLYFYVNGNDFIFGNPARDLFYSNDPNAFGNYFEIVKNPSKHFTIYGHQKLAKQLLYFGIEQYLSHFINTVLYKSDSIESYRPNFPLRFLFETDIEDKEKLLIENLFSEAGYDNVERINYNESLFEVLCDKGIIRANNPVLLLNGIDNTLYLELYKDISESPTAFSKLEGQGADPRVKILADMIIEYIITQNSYLSINKEIETAALLPYSANLLESITPIIKGDAILTDGKAYWFRINERNLNDRLLYYTNDGIIYTAIEDIFKSNSMEVENATILLGSEEINSSYFSNKLLKKYPIVKGVETVCGIDTMKLVFFKIEKSGYLAKRKVSVTPHFVITAKTDSNGERRPQLPIFIVNKNKSTGEVGNQGEKVKIPNNPLPHKIEYEKYNIKTPPKLPPKKENIIATVTKPKLPEVTKKNTVNKNPVQIPPLPPKNKN